jgi:hypothetical protein
MQPLENNAREIVAMFARYLALKKVSPLNRGRLKELFRLNLFLVDTI